MDNLWPSVQFFCRHGTYYVEWVHVGQTLDNQASNDQIYCTTYIYMSHQELLIYHVVVDLCHIHVNHICLFVDYRSGHRKIGGRNFALLPLPFLLFF